MNLHAYRTRRETMQRLRRMKCSRMWAVPAYALSSYGRAAASGAWASLLLLSEHETRCDASGNKALGDITGFLRAKIAEYFSAKKIPYYLKYIDPSYMIRSVPANANDRLYCGFLGQHAVHAAMSGKTGMVVANIMDKFVHLPLELVTRKRRTMSVRSDLWQSVLETTGGFHPFCFLSLL